MSFDPKRRLLIKSAVAAPFILRAGLGRAATVDVKFSNAAPFDGSNAAYFLGDQKGWYKEAGLNCQFDAAGGSGEAVSRVGSGVYDLGVADINNVMEFNLKNPGSAIKGVYMLYYRSPLCVVSMAKAGIARPADLAGKRIGAAAADGAYRLFPAFSKASSLDTSAITWNMVGLQLREATLVRNEADAILGFDSTLYFGLKKAGVNLDDLRFLYYSDVGLDLYGNCIVVSQKMRAANPEAVKRFVEVTARAWQAAAADPKAAIAALKAQVPLVNADLEEEKLRWLLKNQLTTAESKADGLGGIREDRLVQGLTAVSAAYGLAAATPLAETFDPSFLPDAGLRKLPA